MNEMERRLKVEYLQSLRWLESEIEDDQERLDRLEARMYGAGISHLSDMPKGGRPVTVDILVERKEKLIEQIHAKEARRDQIVQSVERIPNERDRRVLKLKFFEDLTYEEVAEKIDYSPTQTRRIVDRALKRLKVGQLWSEMNSDGIE